MSNPLFNWLKLGETFNFEEALGFLRKGSRLSRKAWERDGSYIQLEIFKEINPKTIPYLYIYFPKENFCGEQGAKTPYSPNSLDLFANDWYNIDPSEYEEKKENVV